MTRAERAAQVAALHAAGHNTKAIAKILGISRSYAFELRSDPAGDKTRERKLRAGGTCADCGSPTSYGKAGQPPARRCSACEKADPWSKYWTRDLVIDALREFQRRYGSVPTAEDWLAGRGGTTEQRRRFYEDACWPHTNTVRQLLGSWREALRAAGFEHEAESRGGADATTRTCKGCGCAYEQYTTGCFHCRHRRSTKRWHARKKAAA